MILIVASAEDPHARYVSALLTNMGHEVAILDIAAVAKDYRLTCGPDHAVFRCAEGGQRDVDLARVSTIWFRRPDMVRTPSAMADPKVRQFTRHEWSEAINGMILSQRHITWVNHPIRQSVASKPYQLSVAKRIGLTIPDTIITSDINALRDFVARHHGEIVHKSISSPADFPMETLKWTAEDDRRAERLLHLAPAIFQVYVAGDMCIRCVVIGKTIMAVRIVKDRSVEGVDSRFDLDGDFAPHDLPGDVTEKLLRFMDETGLVFGVIDLMQEPGGDYVFLEVNPQGQFLFMEIRTGLPIGQSLARYLAHVDLCMPLPMTAT